MKAVWNNIVLAEPDDTVIVENIHNAMPPVFRILFVGNSYTTRNDMPLLFARLAHASCGGLKLDTRVMAFGGASLAAHWNRGDVQALLASEKWDAVILQDQSTRPMRALGSMQKHVRLLVDAIHAAGTKPFLYMTWARKNDPESQGTIAAAYTALAEETGAGLIPVGTAWQAARQSRPDLDLHDPDMSHPSLAGSYLAACVFLVALFDKMPVGTETTLKVSDTNLLQAIAWHIAQQGKTFQDSSRLLTAIQ